MVQSGTDALEESDLWTAWKLFPLDDDQTSHSKDIEWAIELLYNSVKTGSQLVWRSESLVTRCGRENSIQWSGPLGLRLSSPGEQERHNTDGHESGGQYIAVLFGLQLSLTHIFLKKSSLVFIHCVNMYSACICIYMHIYYGIIQHMEQKKYSMEQFKMKFVKLTHDCKCVTRLM